jgi:hypothetical protein
LEYHGKVILDRYTGTTGVLEACFELVVAVDVVVDSGGVAGSAVLIKMYELGQRT